MNEATISGNFISSALKGILFFLATLSESCIHATFPLSYGRKPFSKKGTKQENIFLKRDNRWRCILLNANMASLCFNLLTRLFQNKY